MLLTVCMSAHHSTEDGEKKDKAKEEEPSEPATEEKKVPKNRPGLKKEEPEAFMASLFCRIRSLPD
uniref:Uncharacterized protein n=1 Tax=Anguilla anguilla TaxID=7936 RepID=A0A0E9S8J4_ANGAN